MLNGIEMFIAPVDYTLAGQTSRIGSIVKILFDRYNNVFLIC
ncbi:hypothetical protein RSSM_00091 [Rhodopirellula sallentina SM41]|uniref:Uncharacterized protein n=1 Tax=Rhodopirellula sallentina SM41 TaxID=1263870 RepID=M5UKS5_9BACT|nr:hypothetical protein RSSM_00091 [Rhodopirellula sallentina SM41]